MIKDVVHEESGQFGFSFDVVCLWSGRHERFCLKVFHLLVGELFSEPFAGIFDIRTIQSLGRVYLQVVSDEDGQHSLAIED